MTFVPVLELTIFLLTLAPGVFSECATEEDQARWCRHNVFLLYDCGAFNIFVALLNMEAEYVYSHPFVSLLHPCIRRNVTPFLELLFWSFVYTMSVYSFSVCGLFMRSAVQDCNCF